MSTPVLIACIVACVVLLFLSTMFLKPIKKLVVLLLHSVFGWAGLYILNLVFSFVPFSIGINIASATIAGVLGIPGVLLMALVKWIYQL